MEDCAAKGSAPQGLTLSYELVANGLGAGLGIRIHTFESHSSTLGLLWQIHIMWLRPWWSSHLLGRKANNLRQNLRNPPSSCYLVLLLSSSLPVFSYFHGISMIFHSISMIFHSISSFTSPSFGSNPSLLASPLFFHSSLSREALSRGLAALRRSRAAPCARSKGVLGAQGISIDGALGQFVFGNLWDYYGIIMAVLWEYYGIILGVLWDYYGMIMGVLWDY